MKIAIYDSPAGTYAALAGALARLSPDAILCSCEFSQLAADETIDLLFLPIHSAGLFETPRTKPEIVLIGEAPALSPDTLHCRPIGLLPPDADDNAISAVIERFEFYRTHADRMYTLRNRDLTLEIPHASVRYFHSAGHTVTLHTDGGEALSHSRKLDDIEHELAHLPYLRCHQRYLVHLPHVEQLDHQNMQLVLCGGERVPVSKRHLGRAVNAILARNQI